MAEKRKEKEEKEKEEWMRAGKLSFYKSIFIFKYPLDRWQSSEQLTQINDLTSDNLTQIYCMDDVASKNFWRPKTNLSFWN